MYNLFILFFGSLIGIAFMIGRKLIMVRNGRVENTNEVTSGAPILEELKQTVLKRARVLSHVLLVETIRLYVRTGKLLGDVYQELKTRIKNSGSRNSNGEEKANRPPSGFLKMITDYKQKIRRIKRRINEEEENKENNL